MRFFSVAAINLIFISMLFTNLNSALAEIPSTDAVANELQMSSELIAEPLKLNAAADFDLYTDIITKSFISLDQDPWEKAYANLGQVKRYWLKEIEINPAQSKLIENYIVLNDSLQAYLLGSYALDKVKKADPIKAREFFLYAQNNLASVETEILSANPKLSSMIERFNKTLRQEIKDIDGII